MVDLPHFHAITSIGNLWRAYKSILRRCYRSRRCEPKLEAPASSGTNVDAHEDAGDDRLGEESMNGVHGFGYGGEGMGGNDHGYPYRHRSVDNCFPFMHSPTSRTGSRRSNTSGPSSPFRCTSREGSSHGVPSPASVRWQSRDPTPSAPSLSRTRSGKSSSNISFSNSSGLVKPPPIEKKLECTLEELCYGCKRKIKITRDVVTNTGQIIQEEEMLTIKVKPGWKKGTKITFEGMGNEKRGSSPADIVFVIAEKRHPLFKREGDDLELSMEIPLVKALTGCTISVPLLGGEKTSFTTDDIIYPGCTKIIASQGMPKPRERGKRGNLKITFQVQFPTELSDEQRADILDILENSC